MAIYPSAPPFFVLASLWRTSVSFIINKIYISSISPKKMYLIFFQFWQFTLAVSTKFRVASPICSEIPLPFEHQLSSTCDSERLYGHGDACHVECDTRIELQCHCIDNSMAHFSFLLPDGCQWRFDNECEIKVQYSTAKTTIQLATESLSYVRFI